MEHHMSKIVYTCACIAMILAIAAVPVLSDESAELEAKVVSIGDILDQPDEFIGKNVTFNGTISSMCGSGCWFIIADDTGDMYVTTRANNFVIPQSMGKVATVTGTVLKKHDAYVLGSSVVIGDTEYS